MITGFVDPHGHPFVDVVVGGRRAEVSIMALVDTGFDGELCLPTEVAVALGLEEKARKMLDKMAKCVYNLRDNDEGNRFYLGRWQYREKPKTRREG